jgi:hypothetical protein
MVPENYWEQTETDRETGKQKRKQYPVPTHLDPKDPGVWTHKSGDRHISQGGNAFTDGEILVSWAKGYKFVRDDGEEFVAKVEPEDRRNLIFVGAPTPGMEPLDDEAKEIMKAFRWADPMKDKYFGMTYAERLIFDKVTNDDAKPMAEILKAMTEMMAQNQALIASLVSKPPGERRV